jgi:hypothetical protein
MKKPRKIIVVLQGGLGNQLFQYCAARTLAALASAEKPILHRKYGRWHTGLAIDEMLPEVVITDSSPHLPSWMSSNSKLTSVTGAALNQTGRVWRLTPETAFSPIPRSVAKELGKATNRPIILDGYFQHSSWYEQVLSEVLDELIRARRSEFDQAQEALPVDTLALTVRGTDYVQLGWDLEWSYYERGLTYFRDQGWNGAVVVLADDETTRQSRCRRIENLGFPTVDVPQITSDITTNDFLTIAAAPYRLIANSTFAWWAAQSGERLAQEPRNNVAIPDPWIEGENFQCYPETWTRLRRT